MTGLACFATVLLATASAQAQGTVKIGVIMSYSGQFADTGTQIGNGIKLYMNEHGDTVAGKKIELVPKDSGGIAPDVAKRLAQETIVRDKVDILAGFDLTPNALAAADVSAHHHHEVALHGAHLVHGACGQRSAWRLGLQERHPQGLHARLRLQPRP
jgi:branched-chain amino acid transport system substrate-binding protein